MFIQYVAKFQINKNLTAFKVTIKNKTIFFIYKYQFNYQQQFTKILYNVL